tara:strand:+ start:4827 stop:5201 length:375 start_codon:yes stop_codon:yes gene_type:complete
MKGGYKYKRRTFKSRTRRFAGKQSRRRSSSQLRRRSRSQSRRRTRRHSMHRPKLHIKHRTRRYSMTGGSLTTLDPAIIVNGENKILPNNEPTVGPSFNTSAGYGYDFSDPPLGGVTPNKQCTQY